MRIRNISLTFILFLFFTTLHAQRSQPTNILQKMFYTGEVCNQHPQGNHPAYICNVFRSVKKNNISFVDPQKQNVDISVLFWIEKDDKNNINLYIIDSENMDVICHGSLVIRSYKYEDGFDYYMFDCTYDNLMGNKKITKPFSIFASRLPSNNKFSIIMPVNNNLTLNMAGESGFGLEDYQNPLYNILK